MLDIRLIREKPDVVKKDLKRRGASEKIPWIDELLEWDRKRREAIGKRNELRHRRNLLSQEVGRRKARGEDVSDRIREIQAIPREIKALEAQTQEAEEKVNYYLYRLPNLLHESVPVGEGEEGNVEVRRWGEPREIPFRPRDHIELGLALDLFDIERAGRAAGARFYYLKGDLARLNLALLAFAADLLSEKGFLLLQPPYMLRRRAVEAATDLADFEEVLYKVEGEDLYLIPTSEHPLLALHLDEILEAKDLPLRYGGISPCFRKEAGAHGRDTKGIFRVHQFEKVEQFVFCRPEESEAEHEALLANAEEVYRRLGLPYRVVEICTGEIGTVAARKYDLEVWLPGQGKYREVVSCSNCTDYQARRANIRYREFPGDPTRPVHTLNSTLLATERTLVAILENCQEGDGTVRIPKVLVPYIGGKEAIGA
jgi:seryl-tRNA synthetase